MGDENEVKAVRDNPELLVNKFIKNYYSPTIVISQETAIKLRDFLIAAPLDRELERCESGGHINVKAEQIGGPDELAICIVNINAERE